MSAPLPARTLLPWGSARQDGPGLAWPGWLLLCVCLLWGMPAWASSSLVQFNVEEFGKREVLTFTLPSAEMKPRLTLLTPTTLRVTIPKLLALPLPKIASGAARFLDTFSLEEIPGGEMGLYLTLTLKEPYLDFRGRMVDANTYRLEFERYPVPSAAGPTRLLEGRVLPGRDGTLLVLSYTGHGWVDKMVDYGARVIRLQWQGGSLDQGWRPVKPEGLVEEVNAYAFPRNQTDMEISIHKQVNSVFFYRNAAAGLLIVELRTKGMVGREQEVAEITSHWQDALARGQAMPLNRLTPIFVNSEEKLLLAEEKVDEAFFWEKAKSSEREHNYAKARAYLQRMLELFPNSVNGELAELLMVELASRMNWEYGWLLAEVESVLAKYPNSHRYPEFRLLQLKTYNRASRFESSSPILDDPNLPKNDPRVMLERSRTHIGLRQWEEGAQDLEEVFHLDQENGDFSAEAAYLQAHMAQARGNKEEAVALLDNLSRDYLSRIANQPEWLLDVGDIYFHNQEYHKSLAKYALFMNYYPKNEQLAPWALLRAAESRRFLGEEEDARHLYQQLLVEYPDSQAATWGRIYRLQLDTQRPLDERLNDLDSIIAKAPVSGAIVEAVIHKAILQGEAKRYRDTLATLNGLLTLTSREEPMERAAVLKHKYLEAGMERSLLDGRPEYAILLAEAYGENWRSKPDFGRARVQLAEAVLRLGFPNQALPLLANEQDNVAKELRVLAEAFAKASQLGVQKGAGVVSDRGARVRLAEADRLAKKSQWEGILLLLEHVPDNLLSGDEKADRLRLLAKAEAGRGRFPQAVSNLEKLLYGKQIGDGVDYYWYATLLQMWKGDGKSLDAYRRVAQEGTNKEVQALARLRIGDILQRKGQINEAQVVFREAAARMPKTPLAKVAEEIAQQLEMSK